METVEVRSSILKFLDQPFKFVLAVSAVSIAASLVVYLISALHVTSLGGPDPFFFVLLPVGWFMMVVLIASFIGMAMMINSRHRWLGSRLFVGGVMFVGLFVWVRMLLPDPRMPAFERMGERLTPLVEAIEAYHSDKGSYPESLETLVPDYLEELPSTGMRNYPEYRYFVVEDPKKYAGNPWVIVMNTGFGMGFDQFLYLPLKNYSDLPYGAAIEALGEWGYYHE